jgi:hypothetical protein
MLKFLTILAMCLASPALGVAGTLHTEKWYNEL